MLELNNISFTYTDEPFIENLSLMLDTKAPCILLSGKNGSGKTTLLNLMCELLPAYDGSIERHGMSIGYLPYQDCLIKDVSVLDNFRFYNRIFNDQDLDLNDSFYNQLLQIFSIDYQHKKVKQCSSGEQKKCAIVCLLLSKADLLIFDEPFNALDFQSVLGFLRLIKEMKQEHLFLITTHTMDVIGKIADRLLIMEHGSLKADILGRKEIEAYLNDQYYAEIKTI